MSIFRVPHISFEKNFNALDPDTFNENEWVDGKDSRDEEESWIQRYKYESDLISNIIIEKNYASILEIGCGSGKLSTFIHSQVPHDLKYHLIDRASAKQTFENRKYKGTFFVKNIAMDLDKSGLDLNYDLIICNDVLEHLLSPSTIIKRIREMMTESSTFFISVPNWRMGHQFIYRGLFDYDNFMYFMHIHGFQMESVYPSILQTPLYKKLDSEEEMPDELLQSWNFYFVCSLKKE